MAYCVLKYCALKAHQQINKTSSTAVIKTFPPLEIPQINSFSNHKGREILKHLFSYTESWNHKKRLKGITKRLSRSSPNYAEFIPDRYLFIHSFTISNDEVFMTYPGNSCVSLTIKKYFLPLISNLNYSCCNLKLLVFVLSTMDTMNELFLLSIRLWCLWIPLSSID